MTTEKKLIRLIFLFLAVTIIALIVGEGTRERPGYDSTNEVAWTICSIGAFLTLLSFVGLLLHYIFHKDKPGPLFDNSINAGDKNHTLLNRGDNVNQSIATGAAVVDQQLYANIRNDLASLVTDIRSKISRIPVGDTEQKEIEAEVSRIEIQLQRDDPKFPIIKGALNIIYGILIGVAGNVLTDPIIETVKWIAGRME